MGLTRPKVGVVGGTGKMGAWFARLLEGQGLTVLCAGRTTDLSPAEMAGQCDVVVISVPMANTLKVIQEIGPLVSEDGLIMDLTSVKKMPLEAMLRHSKSEVVGAHPLFGPDADVSSGLTTVICPGRGELGLGWLTNTLEEAGIKTVILEPDEHDRRMGIIQGVNHFVSITMALCISRAGFDFEELMNSSTETFECRMERIRFLLKQPARLFEGLLMDNKESGAFIREYVSAGQEVMRIIRKRDGKAFKELFQSLETFFKINTKNEG